MDFETKVTWIPTDIALPAKDGRYLVSMDWGFTDLMYCGGHFNGAPGRVENEMFPIAWAMPPKPYEKGVK